MAQLKIKLVKSTIGCPKDQNATVKSLGLKKLQSTVVREDDAIVRGQIFKVKHLVSVEEI